MEDQPEEERPQEHLARHGSGALTRAERLAILLRRGTQREGVLEVAARLLQGRGELRGLASTDVATLAATHGIGPAKATTIAAAFELGRRVTMEGEAR